MSASGIAAKSRILVVRLGAMGDIVHTLPAVATLKRSHPDSHLTWVVEPQWSYLLERNPFVDRIVPLRRRSPSGLCASLRDLRTMPYDLAVDFQGLIKSAMVAMASQAQAIFGFDAAEIRERAAAVFYTRQVSSQSAHIVDRNIDLAVAASRGAASRLYEFPVPPGEPEGELPEEFVLACPLAGWRSKQWPMEYYGLLGERMMREWGIPLVLNGSPGAPLPGMEGVRTHFSGIPGLVHATRRAMAVVGVDSGPLHLAAALDKPGVAVYGPTDPARNGPFAPVSCGAGLLAGGRTSGPPSEPMLVAEQPCVPPEPAWGPAADREVGPTNASRGIQVLRSPAALTSYKRRPEIDESMSSVTPAEVFDALRAALERRVAR